MPRRSGMPVQWRLGEPEDGAHPDRNGRLRRATRACQLRGRQHQTAITAAGIVRA
jgi:hypothetical protein